MPQGSSRTERAPCSKGSIAAGTRPPRRGRTHSSRPGWRGCGLDRAVLQSRPLTSGMKNSSSGSSFVRMSFALRGAPCGDDSRLWAALRRYHDEQVAQCRWSRDQIGPHAGTRIGHPQRETLVRNRLRLVERHPVLGQVDTRFLQIPGVPRHHRTVATATHQRLTRRQPVVITGTDRPHRPPALGRRRGPRLQDRQGLGPGGRRQEPPAVDLRARLPGRAGPRDAGAGHAVLHGECIAGVDDADRRAAGPRAGGRAGAGVADAGRGVRGDAVGRCVQVLRLAGDVPGARVMVQRRPNLAMIPRSEARTGRRRHTADPGRQVVKYRVD